MSLRDFLKKLAGPSGGDYVGSLLHKACKDGDLEMVGELLRKGADVTSKDVHGDMALHLAAAGGYTRILKMLLSAHAPIDARGKNGWTPLHNAVFRGKLDTALLLLDEGAEVEPQDFKGRTPLDLAKERREWNIGEILVSRKNKPKESEESTEEET